MLISLILHPSHLPISQKKKSSQKHKNDSRHPNSPLEIPLPLNSPLFFSPSPPFSLSVSRSSSVPQISHRASHSQAMSTLDLVQLVDALCSAKIKPRSDALAVLESRHAAKVRLSPAQFAQLTAALAQSILSDHSAWLAAQNSRAARSAAAAGLLAARVASAASLLADFVEAALANTDKLPSPKALHSLLATLALLGPGPASLHVARIARVLLASPLYFHSLSADQWRFCWLTLLVWIHAENQNDLRRGNDLCLCDLYQALLLLLGGDLPARILPFFGESAADLAPLLATTLRVYKRESPVVVAALKLVTKLVSDLATENVRVVHQLVAVGLSTCLRFASTSVAVLYGQMLRFLTLEATHLFASVTRVPGLDQGSIAEPEQSLPHLSLHTIASLVQALLRRLYTSARSKREDASGPEFEAYTKSTTPHSLLPPPCDVNPENQTLSLLPQALCRLVQTYYDLRAEFGDEAPEESVPNFDTSILAGSFAKRRKTDESKLSLWTCVSPTQLYHSMLSDNDERVKLAGLQLVLCHFELSQSQPYSHEDNRAKNSPQYSLKDIEALLEATVKLIPQKNLELWALSACRSVILHFRIHITATAISKCEFQLIRILPRLVKDSTLCLIASISFADYVLFQSADDLRALSDKTFLTQLEQIVDLPDLIGPCQLSSHTLRFWKAAFRILSLLNSPSLSEFSLKFSQWFTEKWNAAVIKEGSLQFLMHALPPRQLAATILWLGGSNSVESSPKTALTDPIAQLQEYIALKCRPLVMEPPKKAHDENPADDLKDITETLAQYPILDFETEIDLRTRLTWAVYLGEVAREIFGQFPHRASELQNTVRYHFLSLAQSIGLRDDADEAVLIILHFHPPKDYMHDLGFPFEAIDYHCRYLPEPRVSLKAEDNDLETEFSQESSLASAKSTTSVSADQRYFLFLAKYQQSRVEDAFRVLAKIPLEVVTCALEPLLDSSGDFAVETAFLSRTVRFVGNDILLSPSIGKLPSTTIFICKLVRFCLHLLRITSDKELLEDCRDLSEFLASLNARELLLNETARLLFWEMQISFSIGNFRQINAPDYDELVKCYSTYSNGLKMGLFMLVRNVLTQENLSALLARTVDNSHPSAENLAVLCVLLLLSVESDLGSAQAVVLLLLEFAERDSSNVYIERGVSDIDRYVSQTCGFSLFSEFKLDLLKTWALCGHSLLEFPCHLFGFGSKTDFVSANEMHITALSLAIEVQKGENGSTRLLESVSEITNNPIDTLILDSVTLCVPLAYTSNGVRNQIFQTLARVSKERYKAVMKEKLILLILRVLEMVDVRSEAALRSVLRSQNYPLLLGSQEMIPGSSKAMISPASSQDLISALISKYWDGQGGTFWDSKHSYFILRQLSKMPMKSNRKEILRRIQFAICLGEIKLSHVETGLIVLEMCATLLDVTCITDISSILSCLEFTSLSECCDRFFLGIVSLLRKMLGTKIDFPKTLMAILLNWARQDASFLGPAMSLVEKCISFLSREKVAIEVADIEAFVTSAQWTTLVFANSRLILELISELFLCVRQDDSSSAISASRTNATFASFLMHPLPDGVEQSFVVWVSEYLARFHLSGQKVKLPTGLMVQSPDFSTLATFSKRYSTLDPCFDVVHGEITLHSPTVAATIESILGSLSHMMQTDKCTLNYLHHLSLADHILPMEVLTCAMLHSSEDPRVLQLNSETFLEKAACIFDLPEKEWSVQFYLALVTDFSELTATSGNLAILLTICISHVPSFVHKTLPAFVCFYLFTFLKRGIHVVSRFLQSYANHSLVAQDEKSDELIKNIVTMVRIGAVHEEKTFKALYDLIDKRSIVALTTKKHLPKAALMLFEDSIDGQLGNVDWNHDKAPLFDAYTHLGEEDVLPSLPGDLTLSNNRLESSSLKYESAFLDASIIIRNDFSTSALIDSLVNEGTLGLSDLLEQKKTSKKSKEWAWKLNQWDLPANEASSDKHEIIYAYFKAARGGIESLDSIYRTAMIKAANCGGDDPGLALRAQLLESHLVLSLAEADFESVLNFFESTSSAVSDWEPKVLDDLMQSRRLAFDAYEHRLLRDDFEIVDDSLRNRCWQCLAGEIVRYNNFLLSGNERQKLLNTSALFETAVDAWSFSDTATKKELQKLSTYQSAKVLWKLGQTRMPVAMLSELASSDITLAYPQLSVHHFLIKAHLANWMAESRLDVGTNIYHQILRPIEDSISEVKNIQQRALVFKLFGHFCESQCKSKQLQDHVLDLERRVRSRKSEIDDIKDHYGRTSVTSSEKKAVQKYYNKLKSKASSEALELEELRATQTNFASRAARLYLSSILLADDDETADKFFSLLLELSKNESFQTSIREDMLLLSTSQALSWCKQLLSRLSTDSTSFQNTVQNVVFQICRDHPFHAVYLLLSLSYHLDFARESVNAEMMSRVMAAQNLILRLLALPDLGIIKQIDVFCRESISLAELKSAKGRTIHLDKLKAGAFWMHSLPNIPPPTMELRVSQSYDDAPRIVSIEPRISIASSGLSLPKIATFVLSNGTTHKVLFKHGTDDLRQDAIMEQVFEKVNKILGKDPQTKKRQLRMRTYKAVPLGPKAGIIEFVPNSKALIEVIRPLHQKADKMKAEKARELMKGCQTAELSERVKVYRRIEEQVKPVMRQYFLKSFVTPDSWYNSRQVYTKGVATTSMVGHILGLGDRHCNNILLDESGEPIHIDLGVAFDQGKRLPIPETVPFRLTRDMVDGLGFLGTEGGFSRLCEHTFRVLRDKRENILSILDVLRWDPLYSWSISPIRKLKIQDDNHAVLEKLDASDATTALDSVVGKLHARGLSVEAEVRELIREATSEQNLAAIYCGWCPFF